MAAVAGLLVGSGAGYGILKSVFSKKQQGQIDEINKESDNIIQEARISAKKIVGEAEAEAEKLNSKAETKNEQIKQKKIQEARKKYAEMKQKFDEDTSQRRIEIKELEMDLKNQTKEFNALEKEYERQKENLDVQQNEIKESRKKLEKQYEILEQKKQKLDSAYEEHLAGLENISKMSQAEAKEKLIDTIRAKAENEALAIQKDIIEQAKTNANKEAKKIVIQTIQRMASEYTIENTVTVFNLESDDIKGQIIGREGRNIRALEASTGVEIVVDDTPEAIIISSFDPIRREVCRLSLKRLVADGRMHPGRIEEVVSKTRKELEEQIQEIGERAIIELDIHGLHPYLVKMVGRMRFRSSYGQNLLKHSLETANLCATLSAELGMSKKQIKLAKRAGLLHDIGKVAEEDSELSHALYGMQLCEKYNESPAICNAVGAHHDEVEMNNIISPIVQACDAISGARPGARREILESYLKRIGELEDMALSYDGVEKAYALHAGRELRVILESDKVDDKYADDLSFKISQRIMDEMQYPGQVKVTVIREKRATAMAK